MDKETIWVLFIFLGDFFRSSKQYNASQKHWSTQAESLTFWNENERRGGKKTSNKNLLKISHGRKEDAQAKISGREEGEQIS